MPKSLIRIVVFLLIPCLIADTMTASVWASGGLQINPTSCLKFTEQALGARLREAFHEKLDKHTAWLMRLHPRLEPASGSGEIPPNKKRTDNTFSWETYRPRKSWTDRLRSVFFSRKLNKNGAGSLGQREAVHVHQVTQAELDGYKQKVAARRREVREHRFGTQTQAQIIRGRRMNVARNESGKVVPTWTAVREEVVASDVPLMALLDPSRKFDPSMRRAAPDPTGREIANNIRLLVTGKGMSMQQFSRVLYGNSSAAGVFLMRLSHNQGLVDALFRVVEGLHATWEEAFYFSEQRADALRMALAEVGREIASVGKNNGAKHDDLRRRQADLENELKNIIAIIQDGKMPAVKVTKPSQKRETVAESLAQGDPVPRRFTSSQRKIWNALEHVARGLVRAPAIALRAGLNRHTVHANLPKLVDMQNKLRPKSRKLSHRISLGSDSSRPAESRNWPLAGSGYLSGHDRYSSLTDPWSTRPRSAVRSGHPYQHQGPAMVRGHDDTSKEGRQSPPAAAPVTGSGDDPSGSVKIVVFSVVAGFFANHYGLGWGLTMLGMGTALLGVSVFAPGLYKILAWRLAVFFTHSRLSPITLLQAA